MGMSGGTLFPSVGNAKCCDLHANLPLGSAWSPALPFVYLIRFFILSVLFSYAWSVCV